MSSVRIKTEICQYVHAPVIVPPDAQRCDFWGSEDEFEVIIMKELGSKKGYIRDGRAPVPKSEVTSRIMSRIRGKDTKPELELRKALRKIGLSGYRLHWKKSPGRPDIAYPGQKVAIFVHGCFWHRCTHCNPPYPKSHTNFWEKKFHKNTERDLKKQKALEDLTWKVFVFWECQIKENALRCAKKIKHAF